MASDEGSTRATRTRTDESVTEAWTEPCLTSLVASYDPGRHLFGYQLFEGAWCAVDDIYPHETLTSSAIALIGLARAGIAASDHGIDVAACREAIAYEVRRTGYVGGIGLAVWANAVTDGEQSALAYLGGLGIDPPRLVGEVVPGLTTMETAWLASGLLHDLHRDVDDATRRMAQAVVDELRTNRYLGATRLMCHAGPGSARADRLRGHIANFADQIYSVQAFAFASIVLEDRAAAGAGASLADHHCELQGPLGQWWWHYDSRRGHVALRYAVYSVHQHGMAPMALAATTEATGHSYADAQRRSRAWIDRNESGDSMFDRDRATIWRSLERIEPRLVGTIRGGLEALGLEDARSGSVRLHRETRPYEWAWCLYASAIEDGRPRGRSIV